MTNLLQTLLVPIVVVVGLIVLIALGKLSPSVGIPIISAIVGTHLGANIATSSGTPTTTAAPTRTTPPVQ